MVCVIIGNIITAFSWFGVNMLGIGLHSYGFMDAAFKWLMIFNASQLLFIALAFVPQEYWRSQLSRPQATRKPKPLGKPRPKTA
jgi:vacuolar-type H+-ATPase subunit I/STV1